MSVLTLRRMAQKNIEDADRLLEEWRMALDRGDFNSKQASPIVDALLDLRTAAALLGTPAGRQKRVKA